MNIANNKNLILSSINSLFLLLVFNLLLCGKAHSQIEPPDRRYLYESDKNFRVNSQVERANSNARKQRIKQKSLKAEGKPFNIEASTLKYDTEKQTLFADGEVSLTFGSSIAEASKGKVNSETNDVTLEGDVKIEDVDFDLTADLVELNMKQDTGKMSGVSMQFEQGDYNIVAEEVTRVSKNVFELKDAKLSTCNCQEGESCKPWELDVERARIEDEGYGVARNVTLNFEGVPVLYTPYIAFPVKRERQTGFLSPSFGTAGTRGFKLATPFYWAIDGSTDATIQPVVYTAARVGADLEFRKVFSRKSKIDAGLVYFNESLRGGDLQGTVQDGFFDKEIDENRFGAYLQQNWSDKVGPIGLQWIADGHYVSDDFLPREYERNEIAPYNTRFVTSRASARAIFSESTSFDLSSEYNQSILTDDDLIFQRLPEASLYSLNVLKPFGKNPYGLKLVSRSSLSSVTFDRKTNYRGSRNEFYQRLGVPFYYQNYFEGNVEGFVRASQYSLSENGTLTLTDPESGKLEEFELKGTSDRFVPGLSTRVGTVFENVYDVSDSSFLKAIHDVGRRGRAGSLQRFKHTVEPVAKYQFVPRVDQDDNPQFDANDRLAERNLFTYGLVQRLFSRTQSRAEYLYGVEEVTPEVKDLASTSLPSPLEDSDRFGVPNPDLSSSIFQPVNRGEVGELLRLEVYQSYDLDPTKDDPKTTSDNFSDLGSRFLFTPNEYLGVGLLSNFSVASSEFNSYGLDGLLRTKRGDRFLARMTFTDSNIKDATDIRQIESNAEIVLTEKTRMAYYARYNDILGKFAEQKGGLRFYSNCNCWVLDLTIGNRLNPNITEFGFNITLLGLGEFGNSFQSQR